MAPIQLHYDDFKKIFFRDPSEPPLDEYNSPLYSLRRDINICLNQSEKNKEIAIWPAALLILIGIDLMSSYFPSTKITQGGKFRDFCAHFLGLNSKKRQALWNFRCSLAHNYGLNVIIRNDKYEITNTYKLGVTYEETDTELIQSNGPDYDFLISIYILRKEFEQSIKGFQTEMESYNCERKLYVIQTANTLNLLGWHNDCFSPSSSPCVSGSYVVPVNIIE